MSEWQPIATAPRDGRWLLLWTGSGFKDVSIGCWVTGIPADEYGEAIPDRWESDGEGFPITPTHWMPFPAAPTT